MKLACCGITLILTFLLTSIASAAPSTLHCNSDPGESPAAACSADEIITHIHETSAGKVKILSPITVECNVLFLGEAGESGAPQVIEGTFTYTSCGSSCTITEENGPSIVNVSREGHETATAAIEGEMHVNCTGINCYYSDNGLEGTASGPLLSSQENGDFSIKERELFKVKGLFCPTKAFLDITTTPLSPSYITASTAICGEAPKETEEEELVCPEGSALSSTLVNAESESESVVELEFLKGELEGGTVTCETSDFASEISSSGGGVKGEVTSFDLEECSDNLPGCTFLNAEPKLGMVIVFVAYRNSPAPEGVVRTFKPSTNVNFQCQAPLNLVTCNYGNNNGESMVGSYYNTAQKVWVNNALLSQSGGPAACFPAFVFRASFDVYRNNLGSLEIYVSNTP